MNILGFQRTPIRSIPTVIPNVLSVNLQLISSVLLCFIWSARVERGVGDHRGGCTSRSCEHAGLENKNFVIDCREDFIRFL